MRRVSLALLLAAGLPAVASPAQAGPLDEVLARTAPEAQPVQLAQRGDRDRRGERRDYRRDRADNRRNRSDNRRDYRRDRSNDRREDWRDRRDDRRDWARDHRRDYRDWNRNWRNDRRYDWRSYRNRYRSVYRPNVRYYAPYRNHRYSRLSIGIHLGSGFYGSRYWISDPWRYRLPPHRGYLRWIRYYDDVLLVDTRSGYVVDVIYGFFW